MLCCSLNILIVKHKIDFEKSNEDLKFLKMRLPCTVQVHNRTSCSLDINMRKKPQQAVLTIGKNSKDNSAQILLQTVQNKPGVKYKVICNNFQS